MGLLKWPESSEWLNEPNPVKSIVNQYRNCPKSKYITVKSFSLRPVTPKDELDVISILEDTKSSGTDITLGILTENKTFPQNVCKWIKDSPKTGTFPDLFNIGRSNTYTQKGRSI